MAAARERRLMSDVQTAKRGDFWFFWPARVRYAEIDAQGVVFNANYLAYFDTAITDYIRALPYRYGLGGDPATGTDFHIVKATVEYKAPIRFDDEIEVGVRTAKLGRTSIAYALAIFPKGGERLLSTGEVIWVNTDMKAMKSAPLPEALIAAVRKREAVPA
jgi:acyl-CoA thioester hydrolase